MNRSNNPSWYIYLNRLVALSIFLSTLTLYVMTSQSSVAYWDCAEYAATSPTLEVPHPPGAPLFTLVTRIASMIPFAKDIAFRMNLVSGLASAFAIMFLYLIGVRLISRWSGRVSDRRSALLVYGPAAIGALSLAVSDTFWFNAVESGLFATAIFFIAIIIWLAILWFDETGKPEAEKYLLLAAYLLGLSSGVHQLCLLAYFPIALLFYFRNYEFNLKSAFKFSVSALAGFFVIYPGIVKWFVEMLSGNWSFGPIVFSENVFIRIVPIIIVAAAIYGIVRAMRKRNQGAVTLMTAGLLVLVGYSTYTLIYVRANSNPPINENDPSTLQHFVGYLEREQYGKQPLLFPRRWNPDPIYQQQYAKYTSDLQYYWSYQLGHMYLRYLGFNFIGRAGDVQDAPVALFQSARAWRDGEPGFPARYFAIPFLLALFGIWYHFKKDWKLASVVLVMFIIMGFVLTVYFNMADPQPRERDYFFVGSFFAFAIWIGIGVNGIIELMIDRLKSVGRSDAAAGMAVVLLLIVSPVNMFRENLHAHDRHDNLAPLDVSYDILQSCPENAILFTGGDNDTFPLWYLQETLGVRTDVRVICLSLANTDWYLLQLKNDTPHGAERVPFTFTDKQIEQIANMGPERWNERALKLDVPKDVYAEFGAGDTNSPGYIEYTVSPTIGSGETGGVRVQDIMVNSIVTANAWHRPICFAVTVSPHDCIGLQKYFMRQGLVYVLTPEFDDSPYYARVNATVMHKCLFDEVTNIRRDFHYGFLYKHLDEPGEYYDSNTRNMIYTLRDSFVTLASYYQAHHEDDRCIDALDKMELKMPIESIPMNYIFAGYVARIYYYAGAVSQSRKYAAVAEIGALEEISENPNDLQSNYNPYSILLGLYDMEKEYDKSIALLEKIHALVPNDRSIDERIGELRAIKDSGREDVR